MKTFDCMLGIRMSWFLLWIKTDSSTEMTANDLRLETANRLSANYLVIRSVDYIKIFSVLTILAITGSFEAII